MRTEIPVRDSRRIYTKRTFCGVRSLYFVFAVIRIWLSMFIGVWFPAEQTCDDALMINYADLRDYFTNMEQRYVMLKDLGMPFVLQITKILKVPYTALIGLLWVLAAGVGAMIVRKLTKNERVALFLYVFILFQPSAFESWCGTRLYRAGLLNPLYFITILLAFLITLEYESQAGLRKIGLLSLALGLFLSLTCYTKEDGAWLLMTVLFVMVFWWICVIGNRTVWFQKQRRVKSILVLLLPLLLFAGTSLGYRAINYHYFGVFETNMRTSGESMRFVKYIYKIDAEDKTDRIWASKNAIEKAFEASPTLQSVPELKEAVFYSGWQNIDENPFEGDRLTWVLKDAVIDTGIAVDQAQKQAFFRQVNRELEEAFRNGTLQKNRDRFQVYSSIGGISKEGLIRGISDGADLFRRHVLLDGYGPGANMYICEGYEERCEKASVFTNLSLTTYVSETGRRLVQSEKDLGKLIILLIFAVYRILNPAMLGLAGIGLLAAVRGIVSNRKSKQGPIWGSDICHLLTGIGFVGIACVYCYIIAVYDFTFSEERVEAELMYSAGLPSILIVIILSGICMLPFIKKGKNHKP